MGAKVMGAKVMGAKVMGAKVMGAKVRLPVYIEVSLKRIYNMITW